MIPDSKVHGTNMGPTWGRQDPGGPHVDHVKLAIWDALLSDLANLVANKTVKYGIFATCSSHPSLK